MEHLTVRIPKPLADRADKLARRGDRGYTSRADVVSDALRRLLDDLEHKATA